MYISCATMTNYIKKPQIVLFTTFLFLGCVNQPNTYKSQRIEIDKTIEADSSIISFVEPYAENLEKNIQRVLSYAPKEMHREDGKMESTIGNLMADAVMEESNPIFKSKTQKDIDFCLLNYGGIRSKIEQGAVTVETAYKVMPFENSVVVLKLSGEKVEMIFKYLTITQKAHPISGATIALTEKDYKAQIQGQDFDKTKSYYVATSDYLYHGGDYMSFFENPEEVHYTNYKIRAILIDHFSKKDTLRSSLDRRLIFN